MNQSTDFDRKNDFDADNTGRGAELPAVRGLPLKAGEIKKKARVLLMNGWSRHVLISIILIAILYLVMELGSVFGTSGLQSSGTASASGSSAAAAVFFSFAIRFLLLVLGSLFVYGAQYYFLKIARGKEAKVRDLLYAFTHQPDKYLLLSLLVTGLYIVFTLPVQADLPLAQWIQIVWGIAGSILYIALILSLAAAAFLMFENENMGLAKAMGESAQLMRGHRKSLLFLFLSFIGYYVLGVCSFTIGFLWVIPYVIMSTAVFYTALS